MTNKEKFVQLLDTLQIENWELAWQLAQNNPELLDLFKRRFKNRLVYNDRQCYQLAHNNPAIRPIVIHEIKDLLINTTWEREDFGVRYETLVFLEQDQGLLLFHGPDKYPGLENELIFTGFERFHYNLYFESNSPRLFLRMKALEGFEYSVANEKPMSSAELFSNYDKPLEIIFVANFTTQAHITFREFLFYDEVEFNLAEVLDHTTAPEYWIPDFDAWKTENLSNLNL